MQTVTIEEQTALEQFKEVDKNYNDATAAVRRYAFEHAGRTFTTEFALLEAKVGELALERNKKLAAWADLKQSRAPVRGAPRVKPVCAKCQSDLMVQVSGSWHCNACGSQQR
jgi:hypothetical protein